MPWQSSVATRWRGCGQESCESPRLVGYDRNAAAVLRNRTVTFRGHHSAASIRGFEAGSTLLPARPYRKAETLMMQRFKGRVATVTGAGTGATTARRFSIDGAAVVLSGIDASNGQPPSR
jgi:hypothetical protein